METNESVDVSIGSTNKIFYRVLRGIAALLARWLFGLQVQGAEKLPVAGPYILAPVHRSGIDFLLAALVTNRRVRWMAKSNVWNHPILGAFVKAFGGFPVNRGHPDRAALRTSLNVLADGEPLVVFPEGTRRSGDNVTELFDGAAWLACRARVPLVPVGIAGSEDAMPKGSKGIRRTPIVITIGEPIWPEIDVNSRVKRSQVRELSERLEVSLQDVHDEASEQLEAVG